MRYDLTDFEWSVIEPLLPKDRRGRKPKNNRRVLNGIFYILRTGAPWRDLPERYGALHHRLQSLQPLAQSRHLGSPDGCHRQGARRQGADDRQLDRARASACLRGQKKSGVRCVGRSRGGLTTKIHARVDAKGRPVRLLISPGNAHDVTCAEALLDGLEKRTVVIADKSYDADRVRAHIKAQGAFANIPNRCNRKKKFRWNKAIYRERNHVERFFNKLKQFRRIATRYDKLGAAFFAFVQLASVRIWLRSIESTA